MTTKPTVTKPPKHLSADSRAWWSQIAETFVLDTQHLRLLTLCCEAWERTQEARERLTEDGSYFTDRFGQVRPHPAVTVERESARTFARLLRELCLDDEPDAPASPRARF